MVKRWVDKVIDISGISDRMIVIKVLVQGIVISIISVYATQCGLDDIQKGDFYDCLVNAIRKLGEKEFLVIARYLNGHVGSNPQKQEDQHESYCCGVRNKKVEKILES